MLLDGLGLQGIQQPLSEAFTAFADTYGIAVNSHERSVPVLPSEGGR
jgi:hypothetical protein